VRRVRLWRPLVSNMTGFAGEFGVKIVLITLGIKRYQQARRFATQGPTPARLRPGSAPPHRYEPRRYEPRRPSYIEGDGVFGSAIWGTLRKSSPGTAKRPPRGNRDAPYEIGRLFEEGYTANSNRTRRRHCHGASEAAQQQPAVGFNLPLTKDIRGR
jgi:hypothetical protein